MIRIQFEVEKVGSPVNPVITRKYMVRDGVEEYEEDTGFLLAANVMDMIESIIKCLEDDEDNIDLLRMQIRDRVRTIGK